MSCLSSCNCPPGTKPYLLESGVYHYAAGQGGPSDFPVPGIDSKTMAIDREAETVTISYVLGGRLRVETWRLKDTALH